MEKKAKIGKTATLPCLSPNSCVECASTTPKSALLAPQTARVACAGSLQLLLWMAFTNTCGFFHCIFVMNVSPTQKKKKKKARNDREVVLHVELQVVHATGATVARDVLHRACSTARPDLTCRCTCPGGLHVYVLWCHPSMFTDGALQHKTHGAAATAGTAPSQRHPRQKANNL